MNNIRNIILLAVCGLGLNAHSQDLHFSQFMNSPLLTNPANTGFIPDGDYRLGVNYRNQWASITAFPYKTMSAFGDVSHLYKAGEEPSFAARFCENYDNFEERHD